MPFLLNFGLSLFSVVISRTLRSVPPESTEAVLSVESEEEQILLVPHDLEVENVKAIFAGAQNNHTPDYQRVEQPDSESGVNSNSSSDFPSPNQAKDMAPPPTGALQEGSIDTKVASPVAYDMTGSKDNWIDRNPPSVILQQHRSDEM